MPKRACFEIAVISPSFIQSYWNLAEIFDIHSTLHWKSWTEHNRRFSCFDYVINKMFAFLTNKVPFFSYISYVLLFWLRQEILRTPYLTRYRTGQVERLMACDQIEAKIMKYHTVSGGGMSAVNLAKFNRKILLSSRSNWGSWQMISHKHNWKQLVGSVDRGILFNMHSSYLLCSGSAVRMVKLQAQFRLHFYDLRGFTLNLAQPWTKFSNNETNNRIIIRTSRFIIIT